MAEEQSTDEAAEQPGDAEATAEAAQAPEAAAEAEAAAPTLESLTAELAAAQALTADAKDQVLRAQAETENVRRRAARDVESAHKFALEKFTKALIPVIESLDKAEAARGDLGADDADDGAGNAEAVLEGVSLSLKLFKDTLQKQGVTELDPHGEPFNPEFHEAVAMVPVPTAEPNSVIEVVRKGYSLNGRLMQAAQVVVASAPAEGG